jgi:hypothetical protein
MKACKVCRSEFEPARPMQKVCSWLCAAEVARAKKEQAETKARQAERRQDRLKREELKTIPDLKKEAQIEFNKFIRLRDRNQRCICCGARLAFGGVGGTVDAGHYRSTGSADHLRYHEDNCNAQRSTCNQHGAGRAVDYRLGLIARIGIERVVALESHRPPEKWTRESLRVIRDSYRQKARQLRSEYEQASDD